MSNVHREKREKSKNIKPGSVFDQAPLGSSLTAKAWTFQSVNQVSSQVVFVENCRLHSRATYPTATGQSFSRLSNSKRHVLFPMATSVEMRVGKRVY
jgi:hypothetical protein